MWSVQAPEIVSERGHFRFRENDMLQLKADLETKNSISIEYIP